MEKELIENLRAQVKSLQGIVLYMDKVLAEITKKPTPALPSQVFEEL